MPSVPEPVPSPVTKPGAPSGVPPRPLTDFGAAVGFLTLLPFGRTWPDDRVPRSVGWYPWVGWVLAGSVLLPLWLWSRSAGAPDASQSLLGASLIVAVWGVLTRFLHWDGLADSFDGLWGGSTPERRLEIMRDSRIGSFGAAAMLMTALVQVAAASTIVSRGMLWPLLAAPVIARFSASLAAWELPSARREGLGLTAMGTPGLYERIVAGSALLALLAVVALGVSSRDFVIVTGVGIAAGIAMPRLLSRPVGGMSGDLFGATILLVETVVLLTGAVV